MLRADVMVLATWACVAWTVSCGRQPYVGLTLPPLPEGVREQSEWSLNADSVPGYSIAHVVVDSTHMLWLVRDTLGITYGRRFYQVRTVLKLPLLGPRELLIEGNCWIGGPDGHGRLDMVAIAAQDDSTDLLSAIRRVWRANLAEERFDELPPDRVYCVDEGFYERRRHGHRR